MLQKSIESSTSKAPQYRGCFCVQIRCGVINKLNLSLCQVWYVNILVLALKYGSNPKVLLFVSNRFALRQTGSVVQSAEPGSH